MRLDEIDLKILNTLQQNAKVSNVQLSSTIGLSPAPTLERVKKLEQNGYIESYHAVVNAEKVGLGILVFVEVSLNLHKDSNLENFMEEMLRIPEVVECYHITGGADFMMKVYAESISHYQKLIVQKIARVSDINKVNSNVVLSTVKYSTCLPIGVKSST